MNETTGEGISMSDKCGGLEEPGEPLPSPRDSGSTCALCIELQRLLTQREQVVEFEKTRADVFRIGRDAVGQALADAEERVIGQIVDHWFTQGGQAQFGRFHPGYSNNSDGIVAEILARVRETTDRLEAQLAALTQEKARLQSELTQLAAKWSETATIWEDQRLGRGAYYGSPVGNGKGNIQNWINWLRGCAGEVLQILQAGARQEEP